MTNDIYENGTLLPVLEEFYTLQGEGFHTGTAAYFLRIGGCDIGCHWCDVKESWSFGSFPMVQVDDIIRRALQYPTRSLVVTGGEPSLYPLHYLTSALQQAGFRTFVETSGAYPLTGTWNWVCLSPKMQSPPIPSNYQLASELKVIIQKSSDLQWAEENANRVTGECHLFLQPEWSRKDLIIDEITHFIQANPKWRLSLQSHKYIGLP